MKRMELTCINCPVGCVLAVDLDADRVVRVEGNQCNRGPAYAAAECVHPVRVVTSTVRLTGGRTGQLPVKTDSPVPKDRVTDCVRALADVEIAAPVERGQVIVPDICGTGAAVVATRSVDKKC